MQTIAYPAICQSSKYGIEIKLFSEPVFDYCEKIKVIEILNFL